MPETWQHSKASTTTEMSELIKSEIKRYFDSDTFHESLQSFIQQSVQTTCEKRLEKVLAPLHEEISDLKSELTLVRRKCDEIEQ